MEGHKCVKCGQWWSSQTGGGERFYYITRFCPGCITVVFPDRLGSQGILRPTG